MMKRAQKIKYAAKSRRDFIYMLIAVTIFLSVINFLSSRYFLRMDFTEKNLYTLSESTKKIISSLDDVVNVEVYFSEDLPPEVLKLRREVGDMLDEYRNYSGNKLEVNYINPQESPQMEYKVQSMGIPPVQINVVKKDKQELAKLYLGMAIVHETKREIIPVVESSRNLEYKLTSAILQVSRKSVPRVRWMAAGDEDAEEYSTVKDILKKRYSFEEVDKDNINLNAEADDILIIVANSDLNEEQIFSVDQFLMKGGNVFVMLDRISIGNNLESERINVDNLLKWLGANSLEVKDKLIVDMVSAHAAFSGGAVTYHVPYPYWVKVTRDNFNSESPMVSSLDLLILPWTSPLDISAEKIDGVIYEILAESSVYNKAVPVDESLAPDRANQLLGNRKVNPKPLVVLARGRLRSYFENKEVKSDIVVSAEKGNLLVTGNTRFIKDNFLRQFGSNTIFFENAVDYLTMGDDLIGIRSKSLTDRPVKNLSRSTMFFIKYLNIIGMPLILLFVGIMIFVFRKRRRSNLKNYYC